MDTGRARRARAPDEPKAEGGLAALRQVVSDVRGPEKRSAFEAAVNASWLAVYAIARHATGNDAEAQDITQNAFIALWNQLPRLEANVQLGPYVLGVVMNQCKGRYRTQARRAGIAAANGSALEVLLHGAARPAQPDRAADASALADALSRLPDRQRICVLLCVVEGFTYKEVAAIGGWKVSDVRNERHRGLAGLRKHLGIPKPTSENLGGEP